MVESRFELFDGLIASAGKTLQRIKTNKMEKYGLGSTHTTCLCKLGKAGVDGVTQKELTEQETLRKSIKTIINLVGLVVYFLLSFTTGMWTITWLVFPIIAAVWELTKAILDLKEAEKHEI